MKLNKRQIMETNFYVFRHGETDYNSDERCQGCRSDRLLNEKGVKQAEKLAEMLKEKDLDCIYSSPLLRAVQTANIVSRYNSKIPVIIMQDLREGDFGTAEGMHHGDLRRLFPQLLSSFLHPTPKTWDICFPSGESKHQMFERSFAVLQQIAAENVGKNIGISLHAGIISALSCGMELWDVSYEHCSVLHLSYNEESKHFCQE